MPHKQRRILPLKRILCPTDFSEPSYIALKAAIEMAQHFQAGLAVLHVFPPVPRVFTPDPETFPGFDVPMYEQHLAVQNEKALEKLVGQKVPKEIPTVATIRTGNPSEEIIAFAEKEKIDLIVIATHGQSGWRRVIMGSVTEQVVRRAPCPVLVIRDPEAE